MASKDVIVGRMVAEAAERVEWEMQTADRILRRMGLGLLPQQAIEGGAMIAAGSPGDLGVHEIRNMTTLSAMWRLWGREKCVYAVHPDMGSELQSYAVGMMAGGVFRRLRRPNNPMLVLAEPWPCVALDGGPGLLLAVMLCGRVQDSTLLCHTTDPRMGELTAVAVVEYRSEERRTVGLDYLYCSIPTDSEARFTVRDLALRNARRAGREEPTECEVSFIGHVLRLAMYLCSSKADIQEASPATSKGAGKGKSAKRDQQRSWKKPDRFLRLGWRLGPALKAARVRAQQDRKGPRPAPTGSSGRGGWRLPPHQRSGHLKTVWCGPGRTVADSALVEPYWVSEDLLDAEGMAPEGVVRSLR
ncbi:hypothetical protein [Kitasatospora sp. NPDC088346]|uniref:hypothetical protein n=1 Tax=Kitasatospora sp. NPDC088346 TaxID=3364073 RepID=UPI00380CA7EE